MTLLNIRITRFDFLFSIS